MFFTIIMSSLTAIAVHHGKYQYTKMEQDPFSGKA